MYIEYCYGPKWPYLIYIAYIGLFGTGICRFVQVLYLGRAPRTKETLPDFREKCRVTRHSRVFRGLTGSQRTPRFWGVTDGVSGVEYASGVGKMYTWSVEEATGSGLLVGNGLKTCFLGSSTASFPLPLTRPDPNTPPGFPG